MDRLFSQRNRPAPGKTRYDFPRAIRQRIYYSLQHIVQNNRRCDVQSLFEDIGPRFLALYGHLDASPYDITRSSPHPVIEHFFACTDTKFLDFLEATFQSFRYSPEQQGVEMINAIFREEGIGYELTAYAKHLGEPIENQFGGLGGRPITYTYPKAIRIDNLPMHKEIVAPTLNLLRSDKFRVANDEILRAYESLRAGEWQESIAWACAAFESVMKTICELKRWEYKKDIDTCAVLVEICKKNGLFPPFYSEQLKLVGSIRNKISNAHGGGHERSHHATKEIAEHHLHLCSANILFLARSADTFD